MDKLNNFSSFSRDRVSCVCWVYVPLYRYIPCISYQVLKKRINAWSVHTRRQVAPTRRGDTSAATNRFARTAGFLWKSLLLQKNFVAATSRTNSVWFDFLRLVTATKKFCCGDKDFHKTSPVHTKRFVAATYRLTVLLQLVARPVNMEWSVAATCRCNLSLQLVAKCVPTFKQTIFYSCPLFTEACIWVSKESKSPFCGMAFIKLLIIIHKSGFISPAYRF